MVYLGLGSNDGSSCLLSSSNKDRPWKLFFTSMEFRVFYNKGLKSYLFIMGRVDLFLNRSAFLGCFINVMITLE